MNNFIGEYQINEELCDDIIDFFKLNKDKTNTGKVGSGVVKKQYKDSTDLGCDVDIDYYPLNKYRDELQYCLNQYSKTYEILNEYSPFNVNEVYNIQHYKPGGGFYNWHGEAMDPYNCKRVLVFMTYLNNLDDGGTEFKYYNYTTKAVKGKTLIWPSGFTHTHKGQISKTQEKYIVTGWFSFNE